MGHVTGTTALYKYPIVSNSEDILIGTCVMLYLLKLQSC